jgi:hypothetical protein
MTSPCYHFDEFELDCERFELRRNGPHPETGTDPHGAADPSFCSGKVASSPAKEIVDRLWGKDGFVDTEHGINTAIREIQQALKEQSRAAALHPEKDWKRLPLRSSRLNLHDSSKESQCSTRKQ